MDARLAQAVTLVNRLKTLGFDAVVAGGYPRDIALGRDPKDIDVVVSVCDTTALWEFLCTEIEGDWIEYERGASCTQAEESARILTVFSCKDLGIDVIVYWEATTGAALDLFDYNINQFVLSGGKPRFVGEHFGELKKLRPDEVGDARDKYMEQIARQVGWL